MNLWVESATTENGIPASVELGGDVFIDGLTYQLVKHNYPITKVELVGEGSQVSIFYLDGGEEKTIRANLYKCKIYGR